MKIDCPNAEVRHQITLLKRDKAARPDGLQPALFKEGGEELVNSLTNILRTVWHSEQVPEEWNTSIVIPIFKKGARSLCENHRGISLVTVAFKFLAGFILRHLWRRRDVSLSVKDRVYSAAVRPIPGHCELMT